jgi:hypothetical protein
MMNLRRGVAELNFRIDWPLVGGVRLILSTKESASEKHGGADASISNFDHGTGFH